MTTPFFFLDFDGVVCDSVPECFLSSYNAFHEIHRGKAIHSIQLKEKDLFYAYRPFIRSGEDYMLLHDLINRGVEITSQEIFDNELRKVSPAQMEEYKNLFYSAREEVLRLDRDFWLDLNRLYPELKEILAFVNKAPTFFILSTKKPVFIREILLHHGIDWPLDKIFYPAPKTKKEVIENVVGDHKDASIMFVDDQYDHLLIARENPKIQPFLASWGYVKDEWVKQTAVPVIEISGLKHLVESFIQSLR